MNQLRAFHRDPLAFFQSLVGTHGHRVRFRMGLWTFYLLNDPVSVHFVLSHHTRHFRKGPGLEDSNPLTGQGLLTQEGEGWVQQRRRLAPAFRRENVDAMIPWLDQVFDEFQSTLVPGQLIDLESTMLHLSLLMALRTVFGDSQVTLSDVHAIGDNVQWLMTHFYHRSRSIWRFPYSFPAFNRRYHAHARKLREAIHRLAPETRPYATVWPGLAADPIRRDHEMLTLVIAGYETTGHAMAWALDLLSRHPDIAEHVINESYQSQAPDPTTHPWTHSVVNETLRLYPSVWLLSRRPLASVTVDDIHFNPEDIILISPWLLHHAADWFDEPSTFRPQRWMGDWKPIPYTYIPFGAGPRVCIGQHLALKEMLLALSRFMARFDVAVSGPRAVYPGLTLNARYPLWATIRPRT
ncbi:MAG: hypothetical protein C7B45_11960 [Sulfobacillus acidophilus]|uniref:Cytochrome P450 n=1 Tax=Sulfobacillus acidophilus TaxID=53633 RepID=A0A2T2WFX9_9FIRM|nr:MAG: hypothetical protein C7B45_11960 [Sulfobacillus acidophilus]